MSYRYASNRLGCPGSPETFVSSYDAVAILGCLTQKVVDLQTGETDYIPADHTQSDANGILAGNFRADAGAALFVGRPLRGPTTIEANRLFITTGGVTKPVNAELTADVPTEASVYAKAIRRRIQQVKAEQPEYSERLRRMGEPEIIEEGQSATTMEGLQAIIEIAGEMRLNKLLVITNQYHWLRASLMGSMALIESGRQHSLQLSVQSAEGYAAEILEGQVKKQVCAYLSADEEQCRIVSHRAKTEDQGLMALHEDIYHAPNANEYYLMMDGVAKRNIRQKVIELDKSRIAHIRAVGFTVK